MHSEHPDQRFRKQDRMVHQSEFDQVRRSDQFAADQVLVVKAALNRRDRTRLGLAVSRRVGNAVFRNRWKRVIREAFRINRNAIPRGLDLVVRPRKGAELEFHRVARSLVKLSRQLYRRLSPGQDNKTPD